MSTMVDSCVSVCVGRYNVTLMQANISTESLETDEQFLQQKCQQVSEKYFLILGGGGSSSQTLLFFRITLSVILLVGPILLFLAHVSLPRLVNVQVHL